MVILLGVHAVLGLWALVGFAEWFLPRVPWPIISNPKFPQSILLIQWILVAGAAAAFLGGYAARWRHTPIAMACIYTGMATLCAVQNLEYLSGAWWLLAMGLEYLAYVAILVVLFRAPRFRPLGDDV